MAPRATEVDPLLAVHRRRVDRAMKEVQSRNEQLRRALSDRSQAHALWLEVRAGIERERCDQSRAIAERKGRRVSGSELVTAAGRIDWWHRRVEERSKLLEAADTALAKAQAASAAARRVYLDTYARHQAVQKLADEGRCASVQARARLEERATDDLIASRAAGGR